MSSINSNNNGGALPPSELPLLPDLSTQPAHNRPIQSTSQIATQVEALSGDIGQPLQPGLIGEKPRTGLAKLATPPPLPPNAPVLSTEQVDHFAQMQTDYQAGLSKGAAANQPSLQQLAAQLNATDTNTPEGRAKAAKINAQLTNATLNTLNTTTSGDTLGAFLLLAVGQQSKQRDAESTLMDIMQRGQKTMMDQQRAQRAEQAKQMQKAADKQAKLAFLKPLLAILTVVFSVLLAPTGPMLGLVLAGSMAGFVAGGVISGKKKGTGFDFMGALEGAAMGAGIAGAGAALKGIMAGVTSAAKVMTEAVTKMSSKKFGELSKLLGKGGQEGAGKGTQALIQTAMRNNANKVADDAFDATIKKSAKHLAEQQKRNKELATAADDAADAGKATPALGSTPQDLAASLQAGAGKKNLASQVFGNLKQKGQDLATGVQNVAGKQSTIGQTFQTVKQKTTDLLNKGVIKDDGKRGKLQATLPAVGESLGQVADASSQFAVEKLQNKGKMAEAEAKATQVFLDEYKMLNERAMDGAQALIDKRKQSSDMVIDMMRNHADANKRLIGGFGRG